jgi:hypothetical protein
VQSPIDWCAFYTNMIKTLRITSVVAAILAGVFFVFPVVYGVRSDERIDGFLKQPNVREKFEDIADNKAKATESRVSPLVEQAEAFALYLNPLKATVQKTSIETKTTSISERLPVTPKFKIFATSYCAENPGLSLALIDEPGRGRHWVRQSSKVGHLLIEQVKDGFVVVKGSQETFELEIEKMPETRSLTRISPTSSLRRGQSPSTYTPPVSGRTTTNYRRTANTPTKPQRDGDDDEKIDQLVDKLKDLKKSSASDKTDSPLSTEERAARIEELIAKFKSTRVSSEESKKLGNMGEELKGTQKNTDSSPPEADEDNEEASPPEPDTSQEK